MDHSDGAAGLPSPEGGADEGGSGAGGSSSKFVDGSVPASSVATDAPQATGSSELELVSREGQDSQEYDDDGDPIGEIMAEKDGVRRRRNYSEISDSAHSISNMHGARGDTVSYELHDTELWNRRKIHIEREMGGGSNHQRRCRSIVRLALFGIGFVTASVGFFLAWACDRLEQSYRQHLGPEGADTDMSASVYGRYLGFSLLFAMLAFVPVAFIRPVAAGSGIAEAKAVLNGIRIPQCTGFVAATCKGVSLLFSVVSAMPAGLEGPLIFIGMAIGENSFRFIPRHYAELRSWRMRRDLAAVGTAAGVSVAFLAPIGGILFAAEEGASYITTGLLSQCFAAAITVVVFDYFYNIVAHGGFQELGIIQPFARSLAKFDGLEGQRNHPDTIPTFAFYDYFMIALVGAAGGVMGAFFVEGSKSLAKIRLKHIQTTWKKFVEVMILCTLAATLFAWLPLFPGLMRCKPVELTYASESSIFIQSNCGENEYNELATLLRNPLPTTINLLFWEGSEAFSAASCIVAGTTMLTILLITFGASVSMGIFVPLLYVGAAFGRAWATLSPNTFDVRTYAIVGAAASLNGVARVLISLTVIMMETTNLATFVSPLMIVCLISRWIGNIMFRGEGIYDEILKLRKMPFLEAEPPTVTKSEVLRAKDVMSKEFVRLSPVMQVRSVILLLQQHNDQYDFVVTGDDGSLMGSISRATLVTILWNKRAWSPKVGNSEKGEGRFEDESIPQSGSSREEDITGLIYNEFDFDGAERVTNEQLSARFDLDEDCEQFVNIAHFMTLAPIIFAASGSLERAYELFRTHGLRQLIIIDDNVLKPVGVITRHILVEVVEGEKEVAAARDIEVVDSHVEGSDQIMTIT